MAIQIGGTTVISDDFNIENVNDMRVGLITFFGSSGNINTPGIVRVGGLTVPLETVYFSPVDGATNLEIDENILIVFDQIVEKATTGIGTTANITLRNSSGIGTVIQTIGIASTAIVVSGAAVIIDPPGGLPYGTDIYVVVDEGAFESNVEGNTKIDTYNITTRPLVPGDPFEGGFLICRASSLNWIVSPRDSEVSRAWSAGQTDANTRAQQVSGCTGWFVPTCGQLQNPGYTCITFWDSYSLASYWSSTRPNDYCAFSVSMITGAADPTSQGNAGATCCLRSFRCVTY